MVKSYMPNNCSKYKGSCCEPGVANCAEKIKSVIGLGRKLDFRYCSVNVGERLDKTQERIKLWMMQGALA